MPRQAQSHVAQKGKYSDISVGILSRLNIDRNSDRAIRNFIGLRTHTLGRCAPDHRGVLDCSSDHRLLEAPVHPEVPVRL